MGVVQYGSSPRMRGKHRRRAEEKGDVRIIPAHAGQTARDSETRCAHADHPRACGANPAGRTPCRAPAGSSPRMRGKLLNRCREGLRSRIIPAHAGQTPYTWAGSVADADHPRACGANQYRDTRGLLSYGSSPRMRGKHLAKNLLPFPARIIPAHAGQTRRRAGQSCLQPDHPRACGANWPPIVVAPSAMGSSPRMRGKPFPLSSVDVMVRIIPAHAGQTRARRSR